MHTQLTWTRPNGAYSGTVDGDVLGQLVTWTTSPIRRFGICLDLSLLRVLGRGVARL